MLWKLLPSTPGSVDVLVPGDSGRLKRRGIQLHRSRSLTGDHVTRRHNIPVTKPARTIADLRRVACAEDVRKALRQAAVLGLDTGDEEQDGTRSELEASFLALCRRHRLPMPDVNQRVGPFTVDFLWREQRLVVETDGYRFHRGRQAFEDDRIRDLKLRRMGHEVMRVSYRQVTQERNELASALKEVLGRL